MDALLYFYMNDEALISKAMALLGAKGGKAGTGKAKARDPEKMRAAALVRWKKHNSRIKALNERVLHLARRKGGVK